MKEVSEIIIIIIAIEMIEEIEIGIEKTTAIPITAQIIIHIIAVITETAMISSKLI